MNRLLGCIVLAGLLCSPCFGDLINGDFEYWSDHPDAGNWSYVTTIQDDPDVGWTCSSSAWIDDGYAGYQHILGTDGDSVVVISWGDADSVVAQNLGMTFVPGETYTFFIDVYGESAAQDNGGQGAGENWCLGISEAGTANQNASVRQQNALALAASNATIGDNWKNGDTSDYSALDPADVFAGWQTRSVSYVATAEDEGKEISVFFSGGFLEVGSDLDTCFDNARFFVGSLDKALAGRPNPGRAATDVPYIQTLTWAPGAYAAQTNGHRVYFSDVLDEVDQGLAPADQGLFSTPEFPTEDLKLEFDKTYYWRVDEVNGTPDKTVHRGDVWSFTVEPYSIPIDGTAISVTASSSSNEFSPPERTIDGSGLDPDGLLSVNSDDMWFTATVDLDPWIQYEFDGIKKLDVMTVWNANSAAESAIGWGIKDVEIAYSLDGEAWDVLPDVNQFSRAPGMPSYDNYDEIAFNGVAAKYVRFNIQSNWGGVLLSYGLSEVQFTMIPAQARTPDPASGELDVLPDTVVQWRAGREAAQHTIYVGLDASAVADGSAPSVSSSTNSLDLATLDLALGKTYYWRVDEVNEADDFAVWAGPVWNFATPVALVVDDFEGYTNLSPNRPFQTWLDGVGYSADEYFPVPYAGNGTGAAVGHDIWSVSSPYYNGQIMEDVRTLPGSSLSMPLYYNNAGGVASQTELTFSAPRDWTAHGVQTLSVAIRGQAGNTGTLYVKINDTKVSYPHDPANIALGAWQAWNIDLASVGTNLQAVTTLAIGIDGNNASGMILIDDIMLHPTAGELITPVQPDDSSLVLHYRFDEGAGGSVADASGNGYTGSFESVPIWDTGVSGSAIDLDGIGSHISAPASAWSAVDTEFTISFWALGHADLENNWALFAGDGSGRIVSCHIPWGPEVIFDSTADWGAERLIVPAAPDELTGQWRHWTFVRNSVTGEKKIYMDGLLYGSTTASAEPISGIDRFLIGIGDGDADPYRGLMDEFKLYNKALSAEEILWTAGVTTPIDKPF